MIKWTCRPQRLGSIFTWLIAGGITGSLTLGCASVQQPGQSHARWGEYGGNLNYLRARYTPPGGPGESNFYVDMTDRTIKEFARMYGLTNNHALFVISHGRAIQAPFGMAYGLSPSSGREGACYSARDLAQLLGPDNVRQIHQILIAGCNHENMLLVGEFKRYFVNATTIIHAGPGTDASILTFHQLLTRSSQELIASSRNETPLAYSHFGGNQHAEGDLYVAELYRPGESQPYRRQAAGRELLENVPLLEQAAQMGKMQ